MRHPSLFVFACFVNELILPGRWAALLWMLPMPVDVVAATSTRSIETKPPKLKSRGCNTFHGVPLVRAAKTARQHGLTDTRWSTDRSGDCTRAGFRLG